MIDIISIIEGIISLGQRINTCFEKHGEAIEGLKKLDRILKQLNVVLKKIDDRIDKDKIYEDNKVCLIGIKDTIEKAEDVYKKCIKDLSLNEKKSKFKIIKQGIGILRSSSTLDNIQNIIKEIESELKYTESILNLVQHFQTSTTSTASTITSTTISTTTSTSALGGSELRDIFASAIEGLVKKFQSNYEELKERLDSCILPVNYSFLDSLEGDNPEAFAFWKLHYFGSAGLSISSVVPYENIYVSWARFVYKTETTIQLKNIPTAKPGGFNEIDEIRKNGSRYIIESSRALHLKDIRPLWLPALREALDPLHRGYVKPHDYFSFLGKEVLSSKLKQVILDSCGYRTFIECRRKPGDIALPSELESPPDHVGWMSACQIVSVPSLNELGIFRQDVCQSNLDSLIENFSEYPNMWVYVRYLQTGQIERKHIKDIRVLGGLRIGASISIHHTLENGTNAWSGNLSVMELKAYAGGRYVVTTIKAGEENTNFVFMTRPPVGFDDFVIQTGQHEDLKDLQEFEYSLLGPSTVFTQEPKVGEKIQIYVDGLWHDVKVTKVYDKDVEYVDWSSEDVIPAEDNEDEDSEEIFGFTDDALIGLEKGEKRTWCPWKEEKSTWDIRPYRCLHIGDLVEAPVVYPDYNYCYHSLEVSQLYLPARIIEVEGDRYRVEFSPAVIAYKWWPGRSSNPGKFPRKRGAKETVENPFKGTKVWVSMDRVRPYFGADPHPVLGISSMRPHSWSAFQGIQFKDLQQFSEDILWKQSNKK
ncbi:hypothetical protein F8M41_005537 [Gigaspora margarita]|uniref:Uncharacterized protein n=1 Tax=Gigaspora margarita TaxID=4874 RepID=A0A8H3X9X5_GIGMA|nr:hypothetical protein F8M41_005537 [Gigaspora margarita]